MAFAKRTPMHLQCPLCRSPLHLHAASRGVYCDNKHHFDPAPEGYLDLIPGKKNPKDSDSRALLRAKRRFLEQGHQLPLVDAMANLLAPLGERELVHLGCGEGYYCRALAERLPGWQVGGFDLAKNAIFAANKAQPEGQFVIADPARAPLLPGTAQVLLVNDLKVKTEAPRAARPSPSVAIARQPQSGEHGTSPELARLHRACQCCPATRPVQYGAGSGPARAHSGDQPPRLACQRRAAPCLHPPGARRPRAGSAAQPVAKTAVNR